MGARSNLTEHAYVDHMPEHARPSQLCWFATMDRAMMETESPMSGNAGDTCALAQSIDGGALTYKEEHACDSGV